MYTAVVCIPRSLPAETLVRAAATAVRVNPLNNAPIERLTRVMPEFRPTPDRLSVLVTKYWGVEGVKLTVGFMDNPAKALRRKILQHLNAWGNTSNVKFVETAGQAQVRIAREDGNNGGYWSYLGTDILLIPKDKQTMNLEAFTMHTSDAEFTRVVRHEAGHTLGFPHEHMRASLIAKIDRTKAIEYFMRTQGWSETEVIHQVLTPLEESSLLGIPANPKSIMCYQIPGELTKNGKPILGGRDIDPSDAEFARRIYPKRAVRSAVKAAAVGAGVGRGR